MAPASPNNRASPGPALTAMMRRPDAALGRPCGAFPLQRDLLGEVGDPHAVGATGGDPGLDRRADVVDVDMDVPQSLTADDHQRVAERGERAPEAGDRVVLGVEQVHHLVRRPVRVEVGVLDGLRDGVRADRVRRRHRPATGEDHLRGVQDHAEAASAGVDHAGRAELLELFGSVGEGLASRRGGRGEDVASAGALVLRTTYGGLGGGA